MEESTNLNVSNRKIRKPLMERKRRARINKCLNELHQILTETDMTPKGTKLEKADILEMTVKYLKHVKQSCCSKEDKENLQNLMLEQYLLGFEKCSKEVGKYVAAAPEVNFVMRHKINTYLMSCLAKVKSQPIGFEGSDFKPRPNKEGKILESSKACPVFVQGNKKFKILPSKLANGDFVLLLSSSDLEKSEESLRKSDMWRPW